jgi:hypothetical protein
LRWGEGDPPDTRKVFISGVLFRESVPRWEKNVQLEFYFAHTISVLLLFYFLNYDSWMRDVTEFYEGAMGLPLLASAHYISVSNEIALLDSVPSQMDQYTTTSSFFYVLLILFSVCIFVFQVIPSLQVLRPTFCIYFSPIFWPKCFHLFIQK